MVTVVLSIAVLNLCVGYGLALALGRMTGHCGLSFEIARPQVMLMPRRSAPRVESSPAPQAAQAPPATRKEVDPQSPVPESAAKLTDEVPQAWLELLQETVETNSFAEASIEVFKLEVARYRDQLFHIDGQVRRGWQALDPELIGLCLAELKKTNLDWLVRQAEAGAYLQARSGQLAGFTELGAGLQGVLEEQAAQINTTCSNIDQMNFKADLDAGCRQLLTETARLVDLCHTLRDRMHESLLAITKHENRLESISQNLLTDSLTGLSNRLALEKIILQWWREDPSRKRVVSVVLWDLDGLARINEEGSPPLGDRLIRGVGRLVADSLRKNRGYDVACRFAGQQFIAFLGDTGPHQATSAAERIRQVIRASQFSCDGAPLEVTVSCGVAEVQPDDTTTTLFQRVRETLACAKAEGGNCTFLHEGTGPIPVQSPEFKVAAQTIRLELDREE